MAATPSIDLSGWLDEQLVAASPDLLKAMVKMFAQALMGADADAVRGAECRSRDQGRTKDGETGRHAGPYTLLAADALVLKVREGGRTINVHALVATGVNAQGYREILRSAGHLRGERLDNRYVGYEADGEAKTRGTSSPWRPTDSQPASIGQKSAICP